MTASLYLHVPFCSRLCDYCDFFSVPAGPASGEPDLFVEAALADMEDQLAVFGIDEVPTVYVGGGTPSVLGAARTARLLSGIKTLTRSLKAGPSEFTVEANPESADGAFLRACADGGVNRISLGVQTFHEASRRAVGRAGSPALLSRKLALTAEYFPGAFSADLIAGLPFQDRRVLEDDVGRLLEFRPAHVSLYGLTIEPGTPLGGRVSGLGRAALSLPDGDAADDLWIAGRDMLERAGYEHYEVSSFALPGKTCAHNIRYWRMENWLGAGPAASGTLIGEDGTGRRIGHAGDVGAYLAAPRPAIRGARVEDLSRADLIKESLLMGFRYRGGPDGRLFRRRFGREIAGCIPGTVARWRERGFFEGEGGGTSGKLAVSREGLLFVSGFLRDAFDELAGGEGVPE